MRMIILLGFYLITIIVISPMLPVFWALGKNEPVLNIGKWAFGVSRWILGLEIDVEGLENVDPKKSYVYMANHVSFLDGPLLFYVIPQRVRVILKKSIFRIPVIGAIMRFAGFIPVDRRRMSGGWRSINEATRSMKEKGYPFLIFPEGTRSCDGKLHEFKRGGFFLAIAAQASIIPITIKGTFEIMPKGKIFTRRGKIKVTFHAPVETAGKTAADIPALTTQVSQKLGT
ncbi:MAG: lysophospholipid acyltransferase family protein [Candidatus Thermoplasmatota archaeon]|nr:lysophospholipid acyltransferase family protein [Candidatus Thermoplasmatota archaeon]